MNDKNKLVSTCKFELCKLICVKNENKLIILYGRSYNKTFYF